MFNLIFKVMNANVKNEEVTALGDFVFTSFTRDFDVIKNRFPTMGDVFKDAFVVKLDFVKQLESSLMLTETQKGVTASLYDEAKRLNDDLNFLKAYFADADLNITIVTDLKKDLQNGNIEGAILKIEGLRQFVIANQSELVLQGMAADFADTLTAYKVSMTDKNKTQNEIINNRKTLTEKNAAHYDELKKMIRKIIRNGKLVFKGTVTEEEYVTVKVVQRMRAAKKKDTV